MVEIQPMQTEIEREEDGRFLASVPELGNNIVDKMRDAAR